MLRQCNYQVFVRWNTCIEPEEVVGSEGTEMACLCWFLHPYEPQYQPHWHCHRLIDLEAACRPITSASTRRNDCHHKHYVLLKYINGSVKNKDSTETFFIWGCQRYNSINKLLATSKKICYHMICINSHQYCFFGYSQDKSFKQFITIVSL